MQKLIFEYPGCIYRCLFCLFMTDAHHTYNLVIQQGQEYGYMSLMLHNEGSGSGSTIVLTDKIVATLIFH